METTSYTRTSKLEPGAPLVGEAIHVLEVRSNHHSPAFPDGRRSPPPHTIRCSSPERLQFFNRTPRYLYLADLRCGPMLQRGAPNRGTRQKRLLGEHADDTLSCNIFQDLGAIPSYTFAQIIIQCRGVH